MFTLANFLFGLLVILHLADIYTTNYALTKMEGMAEKNPILANLFPRFGILPTLFVLKILILGVFWYYLGNYIPALVLLDVGYVGLIIWNVYQINKKKVSQVLGR